MSAQLAHQIAHRARQAHNAIERAKLSVAPVVRREKSPTIVYVLIAIVGIGVVIVAQLLLSVAVSQSSYDIDRLTAQQKKLDRILQSVVEDIDRVHSPQYLAANAEALGMVQNANPVYLRLSDSAVLGQPQAASSEAGVPAGSPELVPNAQLDDVPLVSELQAMVTRNQNAPVDAPNPEPVPNVLLTDALPTPETR